MARDNNLSFYMGPESGLPALNVGEPGFCTDTWKLYVGSSAGNKLIGPSSGGITTLGGQTGATQTFTATDDSTVTLTITSSGNDHEFALGWVGLRPGYIRTGILADIGTLSSGELYYATDDESTWIGPTPTKIACGCPEMGFACTYGFVGGCTFGGEALTVDIEEGGCTFGGEALTVEPEEGGCTFGGEDLGVEE